jgi:mitochondrial fission process protein 1
MGASARDEPAVGDAAAAKHAAVPPLVESLDLEEGPVRYAGYAGRLAQFVRVGAVKVSSVRHLAYASDIGEAFRPTVPAWAVNATYAVAIGYVGADVLVQSHKAQEAGLSNTGVAQTAAQTATFQLLASILVPFGAIHTQVHLWQKLLRNTATTIARHGPSAAGLALIPVLPLVDEPIEELVEHAFNAYWPKSAQDAAKAAAAAAAHPSKHHIA